MVRPSSWLSQGNGMTTGVGKAFCRCEKTSVSGRFMSHLRYSMLADESTAAIASNT